jgi:hypothetical protein
MPWKKEIRIIGAGGFAGVLNSGLLFGYFLGDSVILGLCLAMGVVAVEKISRRRLDEGIEPPMALILATALASGILSGLLGYPLHKDVRPLISFGMFNAYEYIFFSTLYPLFILPAYFSKYSYAKVVAGGVCASLFIESYRILHIASKYTSPKESVSLIIFSVLLKGFAFIMTWVVSVGWASESPND